MAGRRHKAISLSTKIAVIDAVEAGTKLKFEVNTEIKNHQTKVENPTKSIDQTHSFDVPYQLCTSQETC